MRKAANHIYYVLLIHFFGAEKKGKPPWPAPFHPIRQPSN